MGPGSSGSGRKRQATFLREIPGQEQFDIFGSFSAGCRAAFQVPRQPQSWIEFPVGQRRQERKHRRRQTAAPQGTRAVKVFPCHGRAAARALRSVMPTD